MYGGLGIYDGIGWGSILVYGGLIMMLGVISVVGLCRRSYGPLVQFTIKWVGGQKTSSGVLKKAKL